MIDREAFVRLIMCVVIGTSVGMLAGNVWAGVLATAVTMTIFNLRG